MIYVYAAIVIMFFLIFIFTARFKKDEFKNLAKKEHKLKELYPMAAKFVELTNKVFKKKDNKKVVLMLKQMHVKENVEKENFIYQTKKTAFIILIVLLTSVFGLLVCISNKSKNIVTELKRNEPGKGSSTYSLEANYDGKSENVDIFVDEYKYTKSEVEKKIDDSIKEIKKEILGENKSLQKISKPLNLISEYKNIKIFWEIEDTNVIGYNGEIKKEIEEDEKIEVNLFATLSFANTTKIVEIPIVIISPTLTQKEILIENIKEEIDESNDEYKKSVKLPTQINGKKIFFTKKIETNEGAFLILALIALVVILIGYDKTLENKVKKRQEQMTMDFAEIVSKLSLLYEAGLSIKMAWEKIVADQELKKEERYAYKEMKLTLEKIKNGMSEKEAYQDFGKRCGTHQYIKLGNILEQNISKGTKGMKLLLSAEVYDSFESRKRLARKKGEEASTKMLIPMIMMLIIVIIIIAVPALMTINI